MFAQKLLCLLLLLVAALPVTAQTATPDPDPVVIQFEDGTKIRRSTFESRVIIERLFDIAYLNDGINDIMETLDLEPSADNVNAAFAQLLQLDPNANAAWDRVNIPDMLLLHTLQTLQEDSIIAREAEDQGITATDAAMIRALDAALGIDPDADDAQARRDAFYAELNTYGEDTAAYFQSILRLRALRPPISRIVIQFETVGTWVNVRHILLNTEAEAREILDLLAAGEDFATLAQTRSTDPGSGARGGDLGWSIADIFVTPFADAVRSGPIGEPFGPVESEFGFHIIEVLDREERPRSDDLIAMQRRRDFNAWLDAQVEALNVEINPDWPDYIPPNLPPFAYESRQNG